jgi:PAS domain S-box-containing protein
MATILIVDDQSINRQLLVTLLGYARHSVLEASNGEDGLELARTRRPDLVIADVLMPTMDGYEFVRRLRAEPDIAHTPVIFFTGTFYDKEARQLAEACGVHQVLTRPAEPEMILRTVAAALRVNPAARPPETNGDFEQDHLRLLTDKLTQKVVESDIVGERLTALIGLSRELASEHDARKTLEKFCFTMRYLISARYAAIGLLDDDGQTLRHFVFSGPDEAECARITPPPARAGLFSQVLAESSPVRWHGPPDKAPPLPPHFPRTKSILGARICSALQVYGWLYFGERLSGEPFNEAEERLALALGAQLAVAYKNARLYEELESSAARLQQQVHERQRAEQAKAQSDVQFRALFNGALDAILIADNQGRLLDANPAASALIGLPKEDILRLKIEDLVQQKNDMHRIWNLVLERGKQTGVLALRRHDGSLCDVEFTAKADFLPGRHFALLRDLTERRPPVAAQAQLLKLLEATTDFVCVAERNGKVLYLNREGRRLVGLNDNTNVLRTNLLDYHPEWASQIVLNEGIPQATQQGVWRGNTALLDDAGKQIPVSQVLVALKNANGQLDHLAVIARDQTEQKRAEQELREREERYRQIVEACPDGLLVQCDGKVVYANAAMARLIGAAKTEGLLGRDWLELVHAEDREECRERLNLLREGKQWDLSLLAKLTRQNGTVATAEIMAAPLTYRGKPAVQLVLRSS